MESLLGSEIRQFAKQNKAIKSLLTSHGVLVHFDDMLVASSEALDLSAEDAENTSDGCRLSSLSQQPALSFEEQTLRNFAVDPRLDSGSRSLIERCQELLLQDIKQYG